MTELQRNTHGLVYTYQILALLVRNRLREYENEVIGENQGGFIRSWEVKIKSMIQ